MASKDELKKQQRTLQRRPRTNTPSYTEDQKGLLNEVSTSKEAIAEPPVIVTPEKKEEKVVVITENVKKSLPSKTEKLVETKINNKKAEEADKETIVKSVTVRLVDIDDADYLKYACKVKGMNMQEFFWSIIEGDINQDKAINPRDEDHQKYRTIALPEIRTIPIPKKLKKQIRITAGMHRLPETRYMAMVIHQSRINSPGWN